VAQQWSELFITADSDGSPPADEDTSTRRRGFFASLRENLAKTRQALGSEIQATLLQTLDEHTWERLEEALIMADVGATSTAEVVAELEEQATAGELSSPAQLTEKLIELLAAKASGEHGHIDITAKPSVILMVGVNGTGKTTTAGKLAWQLSNELGQSVMLAAADTYRAAATEQLQEWARRSGAQIVTGEPDSDPGAVAFEALARARSENLDVVIVDTAGRLHTHEGLMGELEKVRRVITRQIPEAPHETLLTIDATTGQNGVRQAEMFAAAVAVGGIVLTKLDGTARGGIALAIGRQTGIPVKLIGVGETIDDLRPFDAEDFARALIAESAEG
jgi:fused signal recognition particle receptor